MPDPTSPLAAGPSPAVRDVLRPDVLALQAYGVQPAAGLVKLDAMENPYMLPPALQAELGRRLGAVAINRYPGERIDALKAALAEHTDLPPGCALMLGNGSDELISLLALACARPGATVLAPVPGFVMYEISAQLQGLDFVGVPLTADFELDGPAMLAAIRTHRPAITWLAHPNNPTANLFDEATLDTLVAAVAEQGGLVVFDEAYQPFAARSRLADAGRHGHVLVLRTLSKFGLAGLRLGYLIGPAALVAELDKVRPPYNVSVLNAEAALFALEHAEVYAAQAAALRAERERLLALLPMLAGVQRVWPSEANMILIRVADGAAAFAGMQARGVLVKNVAALHPLLANCLRLTVGTPDENAGMIEALRGALSATGT